MSTKTNPTLPIPSRDEAEHSLRLRDYIIDQIKANGGAIPFADFMHHALYARGLGYYSAGQRKFGADGDFVTAPEISSLFSVCIARFISTVLAELGGGDVLEAGPGTGVMACDMGLYWAEQRSQPSHYFMLEVSPELRERQQTQLSQRSPDWARRVHWIDDLPRRGFRGVVVANEVLDAMPVHLFVEQDGFVHERYVRSDERVFGWENAPLSAGPVWERVQAVASHWRNGIPRPAVYQSEINLAMEAWLTRAAAMLEQGMLLFFDYGYTQREYYHEQRAMGTLMCYYRHRAHTDPLIHPGLQDITASVDFSALANAALRLGLDVLCYTTQAHFLLSTGLGDTLVEDNCSSDTQRWQRAQQAKKLIMPGEMGELVKVLVLGKNVSLDNPTLRTFDLRHKL